MKKIALGILAVIVAGIVWTACTQNNGRIGTLFGSWSLEEMTCDGTIVPLPDGAAGATVSFQGGGAVFQLLYGPDYCENSTCTWTRLDNSIVFDFNHTAGGSEPGTGHLAPPAWLRFSALTETIHIIELNGSHFYFGRTGNDGLVYTYKFNRTW